MLLEVLRNNIRPPIISSFDTFEMTLIQRAIALLRRFGTDAHLWLPGIGSINGLTAGNYLDSAGTTLATVDNPVGLVKDALNLVGGIDAIQSTTANKPIERLTGKYGLQYDGSNDSLALSSVPFQMSDDHVVIAGISQGSSVSEQQIFTQRGATSTPIVGQLDVSGGVARAVWRDNTANMQLLSGYSVLNKTSILSLRQIGNNRTLRAAGTTVASATKTLSTTTITGATIGSAGAYLGFFAGNIYPVIAIKGTVTDAELLLLERFVGALSGVQL